jgi:hypothetical protein
LNLLISFITWVVIMFLEFVWFLNDFSSGAQNKETFYVVMVISLVIGATGLNIHSSYLKNK